jgi:hypothetical protein
MCDCKNESVVNADSTFVFMARIQNTDGDYVTEAEVSSVTMKLFDVTDPDSEVEIGFDDLPDLGIDPNPEVGEVIYDTLQTETIWTKNSDSIGFNFKVKGRVPSVDHLYRIEAHIDFGNSDKQVIKRNLRAK